MPDVILIAELTRSPEDQVPEAGRGELTGLYGMSAMRIANDEVLNRILRGEPPLEFSKTQVTLNILIQSQPIALPAPHFPVSHGLTPIAGFQQAIDRIQEVLHDEESAVRKAGFSVGTPIFFWMPRQPAEKLS